MQKLESDETRMKLHEELSTQKFETILKLIKKELKTVHTINIDYFNRQNICM